MVSDKVFNHWVKLLNKKFNKPVKVSLCTPGGGNAMKKIKFSVMVQLPR